jgi:hypothetical protein
MTIEQRVDHNLEKVLRASGSSLKHYTMQKTLDEMRKAMLEIMANEYIEGSNDNFRAMNKRQP